MRPSVRDLGRFADARQRVAMSKVSGVCPAISKISLRRMAAAKLTLALAQARKLTMT